MWALLYRELETLQDRVPPRPVAEIEAVIEQELGMPVSRAYAEFEEDAKAAASLAQVQSSHSRLPLPAQHHLQTRGTAVAVQNHGRAHGSTMWGAASMSAPCNLHASNVCMAPALKLPASGR